MNFKVLSALLVLTSSFSVAQAAKYPATPDGKEVVATADEPKHHVILENKYVRVMRVMIPPGEQTMWHEQHLDYVNSHISGSPVRIEYVGGKPPLDTEMVTGNVRFGDHNGKSEIDRVTNTGKTLNHQVAFEIKQKPSMSGQVDRSQAKGFELVLDKPSVRGWHIKLQPGEGTGEFTQHNPGVRVIFAGERLLTVTKGKQMVSQENVQPADAFLLSPGSHSILNGGNVVLEFNEYELR